MISWNMIPIKKNKQEKINKIQEVQSHLKLYSNKAEMILTQDIELHSNSLRKKIKSAVIGILDTEFLL